MAVLVKNILNKHQIESYNINYIFCSDEYILKINKEYLKHHTYTDIITFDLSSKGSNDLIADIYISIERVQENAENFDVKFTKELLRVIIHGALHLCGYKDKTANEKKAFRIRETRWINYYSKHILTNK